MLLVGLNLRGPIAALSPALPDISDRLSLSAAAAGVLTSIPVLCFALLAPAAGWLGRRIGANRAVLLGCMLVAVAGVVRVLGGVPMLFAGTVLLGAAMTIGNVLVPVVIKGHFMRRADAVTGLYTGSLAGGAAVFAGLATVQVQPWGWRVALATTAPIALVAAVAWVLLEPAKQTSPAARGRARDGGMWRSPVAWAVALFLGWQSVAYYSVTAWLPTLLTEHADLAAGPAGLGMSLFQFLGIPGTLLVPLVVRRRADQVWLGVLVGAGWIVFLLGLLQAPSLWPVWTVVGGVTQGAGISFAFTVLVLRAYDATATAALSTMSQLVGYLLGAAGPPLVGALHALDGGWVLPLVMLLVVAGLMVVATLVCGRDTVVRVSPGER